MLEQKGEGKTDLAEFLINRNPRAVADVMQSTWEIEESKAKLERGKKNSNGVNARSKNGRMFAGM